MRAGQLVVFLGQMPIVGSTQPWRVSIGDAIAFATALGRAHRGCAWTSREQRSEACAASPPLYLMSDAASVIICTTLSSAPETFLSMQTLRGIPPLLDLCTLAAAGVQLMAPPLFALSTLELCVHVEPG